MSSTWFQDMHFGIGAELTTIKCASVQAPKRLRLKAAALLSVRAQTETALDMDEWQSSPVGPFARPAALAYRQFLRIISVRKWALYLTTGGTGASHGGRRRLGRFCCAARSHEECRSAASRPYICGKCKARDWQGLTQVKSVVAQASFDALARQIGSARPCKVARHDQVARPSGALTPVRR